MLPQDPQRRFRASGAVGNLPPPGETFGPGAVGNTAVEREYKTNGNERGVLPHHDPEAPTQAVGVGNPPDGTSNGRPGTQESLVQLDLLRRLCHAFSSATTLEELGRWLGPWVRDATGCDRSTFRLILPDAGGRLRTVASDEPTEGGRKRSARRRQVFRERSPRSIALQRPEGWLLGLFPIVTRGEPVGVLEVRAPADALHRRREVLTALVSQAAIAIRNLRERAFLARQGQQTLDFMELVGEMVEAPTAKRAVAVAARLCFELMQVPVAAWGMTEDRSRLELTALRGVDAEARRRVRRSMRTIPVWTRLSREDHNRFLARFGRITGAGTGVMVGDAGDAVLFIAAGSAAPTPFVDRLVALLRDVLRSVAVTARAERRNRDLDMGIAWTAHEIRRPMLALRFLLLSMAQERSTGGIEEAIGVLTQQLDELVKEVDGMLRWAMGEPPTQARSFDLVRVVASVVEALEKGAETGRLRFQGLGPVVIRGDRSQVQHAVENVVANALTYSPPRTDVRVSVETDEDAATVTVSDQGPGIPAAYRDAIFDPFVRVGAGGTPRGGQGLGLFIAKQIVEGHGGELWLEPGRKGATFRLRLPRATSGSRRFAS
jgi:signal transduction histidine kinase